MRLGWIALVLVLAGCASPSRFGTLAPEGLAEPVMEAAVASAPMRTAGPPVRPRARPAWVEHCRAGDDGIGGTGCPVD
jgi:hypothetical protein